MFIQRVLLAGIQQPVSVSGVGNCLGIIRTSHANVRLAIAFPEATGISAITIAPGELFTVGTFPSFEVSWSVDIPDGWADVLVSDSGSAFQGVQKIECPPARLDPAGQVTAGVQVYSLGPVTDMENWTEMAVVSQAADLLACGGYVVPAGTDASGEAQIAVFRNVSETETPDWQVVAYAKFSKSAAVTADLDVLQAQKLCSLTIGDKIMVKPVAVTAGAVGYFWARLSLVM